MTRIAELYGLPTSAGTTADWASVVAATPCPFLQSKCLKTRKGSDVSLGTCTVRHRRRGTPAPADVIICPVRFLERKQVFTDCLHLLTLSEPGNELHIVPELGLPGGSIDYCLVSAKGGKVVDFVGIELQAVDTTGTVWPERQRFVHQHGVRVRSADRTSARGFGLNWKMTAKTILVQLHHKIRTFEHVSKHLVLVAQDRLFDYMREAFAFGHLSQPRLGDPMHFHSYALIADAQGPRLQLAQRWSTDTDGVARCLGLQAEANVELQQIIEQLQAKISRRTLMSLPAPLPSKSLAEEAAEAE